MIRILILLVFVCVFPCALMYAQTDDQIKEYNKLIWKLDHSKATLESDTSDLSNFWTSLVSEDKDLQKLLDNVVRNPKGIGKKVQKELSLIPRLNPKYYPYAITDDEMNVVVSELKEDVGIKNDEIDICVIDDPSINAFATLSDDGKVICLCTGLLSAKGMTREMAIGVVLHEMVHCKMEHIIESALAMKKRKRKDEIMAGIAAGLNAVAAGADAYAAGMTGREANTDRYAQNIENLKYEKTQDLYQYYNSHSRDQEFQADLIAFRFMQWCGYNADSYIEMLKVLESNLYDSFQIWESDKESDHPTLRRRINFLTYVRDHPEAAKWNVDPKLHSTRLAKYKGDDPLYD